MFSVRCESDSNKTMEKVLVEFELEAYLNSNIFGVAKSIWNFLLLMFGRNEQPASAIKMDRENLYDNLIAELKDLNAAVETARAGVGQLNERMSKINEIDLFGNQIDNVYVAEVGDNNDGLPTNQRNNDQLVGVNAIDKLKATNRDGESSRNELQSIQEAVGDNFDKIMDNIKKTINEAIKNFENDAAIETAEHNAIGSIEICTSEKENQ